MRFLVLAALGLVACGERPLIGSGSIVSGDPDDAGIESPMDMSPADGPPAVGLDTPPRPLTVDVPPDLGPPASVPAFVKMTGSSPIGGVVVGDLDGDAIPDLVTPGVSVLRAVGDGTFAAPVSYYEYGATQNYTPWAALGDLDEDGLLDVAVDRGASLAVRLNVGGGALGAQQIYSGGESRGTPTFVIVDVDGDHHLDLVSTQFQTGTFLVRPGRGDGSFGPPLSSMTTGGTLFLAASGDFDGDGRGDVVYATDDARRFGIATGQANGTLLDQGAYEIPSAGYPVSMATGDLDGDGHLDVVLSAFFTFQVVVAFGDGHGGFRSATAYNPSMHPDHVAVCDLDGNGVPDLVFTDRWGNDGSLYYMAGAGGGAFFTPQLIAGDLQSPTGLAAGDFDKDGKLDFVLSSFDQMTVFLNRTL